MTTETKDAGILAVLMKRLENEKLPRTLDIKSKVDQGECLDDADITFLEQVFSDAVNIQPMLDRHPEYESLVTKMIHLYHEITEQALNNEKQA